jgi:hypothetical protein
MFGSTLVYLVDPDDIQKVMRTTKGQWPKRVTHLVLEHVRINELKQNHDNGGIFMV